MSSVIIVADSLFDSKSNTREIYVLASFKSKKKDNEEKKKKTLYEGATKAIVDKSMAKLMGAQGKCIKSSFACFIYNSPHFAKECPEREKLNYIRVGDNDKDKRVVTHINHMCVLNCLITESIDTTIETSLVGQD